jgi:hypothetical protein
MMNHIITLTFYISGQLTARESKTMQIKEEALEKTVAHEKC